MTFTFTFTHPPLPPCPALQLSLRCPSFLVSHALFLRGEASRGKLTLVPANAAEVERVRQDLQAAAVGRTIARVETTVDEIVFDGVSSAEFEQALVGRKVLSCERRGKK